MDYPWINTGLIILVDCWLKPLGYPTLSNYHCKDWRWIRHCLGFIFLLNNEHHAFLFLCFSAIPSRIHLIQTIAGVPSCSYVVLPMQYFKMIIYTYPFLDLDCRSEVTQPFFWERHTRQLAWNCSKCSSRHHAFGYGWRTCKLRSQRVRPHRLSSTVLPAMGGLPKELQAGSTTRTAGKPWEFPLR